MTKPAVAAIVPAAGASARFGSMKLLADIGGAPLLDRTLNSLLDAGVDRIVLVVAPGHQLGASERASDARVTVATNPDPSRGMFSSIQTGLAAIDADVLLVLPADMPFVPPAVVALVSQRCRATGAVVVPAHSGRRGHPIAIPGWCRVGLTAAPPASTLKAAIAAVAGGPPTEIPVDAPGILRDVDVPEDLEPDRL